MQRDRDGKCIDGQAVSNAKKPTDVLPSSYVTHHRHCHHRHGFKSPIFLSECNPGQVVYTRLSVIKQYNLVPANGW